MDILVTSRPLPSITSAEWGDRNFDVQICTIMKGMRTDFCFPRAKDRYHDLSKTMRYRCRTIRLTLLG